MAPTQPLISEIEAKGCFHLQVFDNGELIEDYTDDNLIVTVGKNGFVLLLAGDPTALTDKIITQIAFGDNGVSPVPGDTHITDAFIKPLEGYTMPGPRQVAFEFLLDLGEDLGATIREFGLLTADGGLFARKSRGAIHKTSTVRLQGTWTITFI